MDIKNNSKLFDYYKKAAENAKTNPESAVINARKAAEAVCKNIIISNGKELNSRSTIEDLLKQIKNSRIPFNPKLELNIRTIQVFANYNAHDQSYQNNNSTLEYHADLSNQDILPCMAALEQMLQTIYEDAIFKDISPSFSFLKDTSLIDGYTIKIGASNLTVPDSIMQGWQCEDIFQKLNLKTQRIPRKWNDKILHDLSDNTLDIAIYNKESTKTFMKNHPNASIHIIKDICSSMGGRNFYILASKTGKWADMTLQQFKDSLGPGVFIAVSKNSDMEKNLLYILDATLEELAAKGVKVIDYHSDQGLSIYDLNPDILVIGGQDLRFLAEKTGDYIEIISYENLPASKKSFFDINSINSLIVGPKLYNMFSLNQLEEIVNMLMINFYSNNISETNRKKMRDKLRPQVKQICSDDETADYIIQRIMFETYRFF